MAGNERLVAEYLFENINVIELPHLKVVRKISAPTKKGILEIKTKNDLLWLSTQDSRKKADIYINDIGISIKQSGSTFLFNRVQRADILNVFNMLGFTYSNDILSTFDEVVGGYHSEMLEGRSRPWDEIFEETYFYKLLNFLMMEGSSHQGPSAYPARLILEAPATSIQSSNIQVFTFDEYFDTYKKNFKVAIRRGWIGQSSKGEHRRATGLAKKEDNRKWVFDKIVGSPRPSPVTGKIWRDDVPLSDRRTVYFISIEKS